MACVVAGYEPDKFLLEVREEFICSADACDENYGEDMLPLIPNILRGENDLPCKLANMNDGQKTKKIRMHSFGEIADWIEANL